MVLCVVASIERKIELEEFFMVLSVVIERVREIVGGAFCGNCVQWISVAFEFSVFHMQLRKFP